MKFVDFILSMKWLWVIVIILTWKAFNTVVRIYQAKYNQILCNTKIDNGADAELDKLIQNAMDEYNVLTLQGNNDYIKINDENELRDWLIDNIPDRISSTLLKKLQVMYAQEYIPTLISTRIYMMVTNYALDINVNNNLYTQQQKQKE